MASTPQKSSKGSKFFSSTFQTADHSDWNDFCLSKPRDELVFQAAAEVKSRLTKSANKSTRGSKRSKHSLSLQKYPKGSDEANAEQNDVSQNLSSKNQKKNRLIFNANDIINEKKLLSKVTIHRIASQRHRFEEETQNIETSYKYWLNKVQKMKKRTLNEQKFIMKKHSIREESKKIKETISKELEILQQEDLMEKSRLRETVIEAKIKKKESLSKFGQQKFLKASRVREESKKIQSQISENKLSDFMSNQRGYEEERKAEQRLREAKRGLEQKKRLEAQGNFKNRWVEEFNKSTKARNCMFRKKQSLSRKMQYLMQELRSEDLRENSSQAPQQTKKAVQRNSSMQDKYRQILLS